MKKIQKIFELPPPSFPLKGATIQLQTHTIRSPLSFFCRMPDGQRCDFRTMMSRTSLGQITSKPARSSVKFLSSWGWDGGKWCSYKDVVMICINFLLYDMYIYIYTSLRSFILYPSGSMFLCQASRPREPWSKSCKSCKALRTCNETPLRRTTNSLQLEIFH